MLPAKWFAAILYVRVGPALVGIGAVVAGGLVFGFEPLTALSGGAIAVGHALGLIALAYLIGLAGMASIVSPAMSLSTFNRLQLDRGGAVPFHQPLRGLVQPPAAAYLPGAHEERSLELRRVHRGSHPAGLGCLPPEGRLVVVTNY